MSWRLLDETKTAVAKDPDCHCPAQGCHCHNNLYNGTTWCTCKPQAAVARRSTEEIQKVSSSSLKLWSRPFCPSCSIAEEAGKAGDVRITSPSTAREEMTPDEPAESALVIQWQPDLEARETVAAMTTLSSVAREETSCKAREETPGTDREAAEAADVRITLPSTAREDLTPDEDAESALVTQRRLTRERPRPRSPPSPWLSSGTTRERPPSESRTFQGEVGSSQNESSVSSSESSSSSRSEGAMKPLDKPFAPSTSAKESSSPSTELSLSRSEMSSSKESEAVVAQHASVAMEETPGIAREETSRKSDSPDARADIRWKAGDAAAVAKTTKKREGSCRCPPARSSFPR